MNEGWIELQENAFRDVHDPPDGWGTDIWQRYGQSSDGLEVEFPSPRTQGAWRISSRGVVGAFPLAHGGVRVVPKVPIRNLLRMIEVALDVPVRDLEGLVPVSTIDDLFDRLVASLSAQVHRRVKRGLLKRYVVRDDRLPYLRGRLDVERNLRRNATTLFDVRFQEPSLDHHDNRVLLATLHRVVRSPLLTSATRASARRAIRALAPSVTSVAVESRDAVRPPYDRLRADYLPMHRLCRFLLSHTGPRIETGEFVATPFLVDMPRLFETFVAQSLEQELPPEVELRRHVTTYLDPARQVLFDIDLVLEDAWSRRPLMVLDTKYKDHDAPSASDVQQVVAYAAALDCTDAALVYPTTRPFEAARAGNVTVRRLGISLNGELRAAAGDLGKEVIAAVGWVERHMPSGGTGQRELSRRLLAPRGTGAATP